MNDFRITELRTRIVDIPIEYPVKTAVETVATSPLVLLDLHTDVGVVGHSYLLTYTPPSYQCSRWWKNYRTSLKEILEPTIRFEDGKAQFGDIPDAGIAWNEREIERYKFSKD